MRENLSLYHIFYTVGRTGSISQAARELYISQPAITKAIKKLEENLDTVLFKRTSRGVTLTPDGSFLLKKQNLPFPFSLRAKRAYFITIPGKSRSFAWEQALP